MNAREQRPGGAKLSIWKASCPVDGCGAPISEVRSTRADDTAICAADHALAVTWTESAAGHLEPSLRLAA